MLHAGVSFCTVSSRLVIGRVPTVREVELEDETALYDSRSRQAIVLNRTASDIWTLLDGSRDLDEIVATLAEAYQVASGDIRTDVEALLDRLMGARLAVASAPDASPA